MRVKLAPLLLIALCGCGIIRPTELDFPPEYMVPTVEVEPAATPLEEARRATFTIGLPTYRVGGSAVIISREPVSHLNPRFRYRMLTAYHVVDEMVEAMKDSQDANHIVMAMFQPALHGTPLRMKLRMDEVELTSAEHDWAILTFTSMHRFASVELATRQEFEALGEFATIYAVGGDGGFGQLCRRGVLGATHNEYINLKDQKRLFNMPWMKHPHAFFRPFIQAWYGASGGGVFNQEGKLIGLINGANMGNGRSAVTHSVVSTKAHLIREQLHAE